MERNALRHFVFPDDDPGRSAVLFPLLFSVLIVLSPPQGQVPVLTTGLGFGVFLGLAIARARMEDSQEGTWSSGLRGAAVLSTFWILALGFGLGLVTISSALANWYLFGGMVSVILYYGAYVLLGWMGSGSQQ